MTNDRGSTWESVDTTSYDSKWTEMAAAGANPHGEVDFVQRFAPVSVLDGGCGTGRVAIELAARGVDVVGVDLDEPMIAAARTKAPELDFRLDDLATVELGRRFDLIVLPGNVMIFLRPGTEARVIANLADHLTPGGRLVSGFQLGHGLTVEAYERAAAAGGLVAEERWATWDLDPAGADDDYVVLVHRSAA